MPARARVLAGVAVRRAVTAECVAALLAGPQVDPSRADFHALDTLAACRVFDRLDRRDMRTSPCICHLYSLALGPHPQRELTLTPRLGFACPRLGVAAGAYS